MDKTVVVGHRGTGKSSLLKRWRTYCPELSFADLDEEIEKSEQKTIQQIFNSSGEEDFRKIEERVWKQIQHFDVISVGGGFNLSWIDKKRKILWVRRDSDSPERIFLDRPALSDYARRFSDRTASFKKYADRIYTMPEGLFQPDEEEKNILNKTLKDVGGIVTLPQEVYPKALIEVRDDLEMKDYGTAEVLYSVRVGNSFPANQKFDWDIVKPLPKPISEGFRPYIISTHGQSSSALNSFQGSGVRLKFCPEVTSWEELKHGYEWQQKDPEYRSFLPRSKSGEWNWFRLWMKGRQQINFWREGEGSAPDQPTLWEWISHPNQARKFAAVLGAPVKHSFSPAYHKSFFSQFGVPFYRIHIEENEFETAIGILNDWGLIAAAVTSPLKILAGKFVGMSATNTLFKQNDKWSGANTDKAGAEVLLKDYLSKKTVVWGGGGVLEVLKQVIPNASFYSSQNAKPREAYSEIERPEVLVWGDPYNSIDRIPPLWNPDYVIDLSYHDKSPARLYSQKVKAQYVSGIAMFLKQAEEQQKLWNRIFT